MNKWLAQIKASFILLRIYGLVIAGVSVISFFVNLILGMTVGTGNNTQVSLANALGLFLLLSPAILPVGLFKKMLNLGASRKEYYQGLLTFYALVAIGLASLNVVWLQLDVHVFRSYYSTYNILEIFHWNEFGYTGSFIYQFVAYLMIVSWLNLLFSGLRHYIGWAIWAVFIAAIPISMSIEPLRNQVTNGISFLLINDSLWQGVVSNVAIACVLFAGGWWFTRRREF